MASRLSMLPTKNLLMARYHLHRPHQPKERRKNSTGLDSFTPTRIFLLYHHQNLQTHPPPLRMRNHSNELKLMELIIPRDIFRSFPKNLEGAVSFLMLLLPPAESGRCRKTTSITVSQLWCYTKTIQTLRNGATTAPLIRSVNPLVTAGSRYEPARIV